MTLHTDALSHVHSQYFIYVYDYRLIHTVPVLMYVFHHGTPRAHIYPPSEVSFHRIYQESVVACVKTTSTISIQTRDVAGGVNPYLFIRANAPLRGARPKHDDENSVHLDLA